MIILIDNYDSFTYNLYHFLGDLGADVKVYRNDVVSVDQILNESPTGIVLSPGPCTPDKAGICLNMVKSAAATKLPLLGVCLGHQSLGQALGGRVIRAGELMHGKTSPIHHTGKGVFKDLSSPLTCTRYHSLIVERETLPDCFEVTAETSDGTIMGMQHKELPLHGVQFHPESIASEQGHALLHNFLKMTGENLKAVA
ncbi:anthranilate synthase component II [Sneathiella limimaris]|uniref:anthranilate synthase component II n=1 Tax=Sneathiella limimaris TaxID=1964213 RepID=UPI00146ECFEA|nr:aminodeoxychorismate/anthranilate synthase component II [Sneathiella limimaris]